MELITRGRVVMMNSETAPKAPTIAEQFGSEACGVAYYILRSTWSKLLKLYPKDEEHRLALSAAMSILDEKTSEIIWEKGANQDAIRSAIQVWSWTAAQEVPEEKRKAEKE